MDFKTMRRKLGSTGWTMLVYYLTVNVCVFCAMLVEISIRIKNGVTGLDMDRIMEVVMEAASSAWGYFLAFGVGLVILLAWKKRRFWKEEIWARGRPMTLGDFLAVLAIFLSGQLVYQAVVTALEMGLNLLGLTITQGLEMMTVPQDNLSMFLYMGILAPVGEELLCRGLIQRTLMPFGKRLAIIGSAFLFGMLHGNIIQVPYAFLVGLVLGYVAAEYSVGWAMVLHGVNNLGLAGLLPRLFPDETVQTAVMWGILLVCGVAAVAVLICRRKETAAWLRENPMYPGTGKAFFASGGVVTFTVLMALSMIVTCFSLITPL